MNLNAMLGVACVVSFTFPIVVIFYNRYYTQGSFLALLIYYSLVLTDNFFSENYVPTSAKVRWYIGLVDNYAYVPLVLTTLLFFCPGKQRQLKIRMLTYIFLAYEVMIVSIHNFSFNSVVYILGPGICVILMYSFYLLIRQLKFSIYHGKNHGRVLILASIFFDCFSSLLIYIFNYILKTPFHDDVFTLYYMSSIVSSTVMAIGLYMMRSRMRELKSIQTTRKELALFFGQ